MIQRCDVKMVFLVGRKDCNPLNILYMHFLNNLKANDYKGEVKKLIALRKLGILHIISIENKFISDLVFWLQKKVLTDLFNWS